MKTNPAVEQNIKWSKESVDQSGIYSLWCKAEGLKATRDPNSHFLPSFVKIRGG